jgi:hypothetical protein
MKYWLRNYNCENLRTYVQHKLPLKALTEQIFNILQNIYLRMPYGSEKIIC